MKKQLFSFVMLALVIVAGTAMAQTATTPYLGVSYPYTLNGIVVTHNSTAVVTYPAGGATITTTPIALTPASTSLSFNVVYGALNSGNLTVTITDLTTNCSNYINLAIIPTAAPTLALAVTTTSLAAICQNLNTGTISDNTAANVGASDNTFTIKVAATTTGTLAADATYSFKFDLNDYLLGSATVIALDRTSGGGSYTVNGTTKQITVSGAPANSPADQIFTVTFATTTGVATETITGTATSAQLQSGGTVPTNYTGTILPASISVDVKSLPTIGSFSY